MTIFDRINAFVRRYYFSRLSQGFDCFLQVADSFVGRWFKLEGSGVAKERQGSRFLVCALPSSFLVLHSSQVTIQTEIRAGVTTWVRATRRYTDVANN